MLKDKKKYLKNKYIKVVLKYGAFFTIVVIILCMIAHNFNNLRTSYLAKVLDTTKRVTELMQKRSIIDEYSIINLDNDNLEEEARVSQKLKDFVSEYDIFKANKEAIYAVSIYKVEDDKLRQIYFYDANLSDAIDENFVIDDYKTTIKNYKKPIKNPLSDAKLNHSCFSAYVSINDEENNPIAYIVGFFKRDGYDEKLNAYLSVEKAIYVLCLAIAVLLYIKNISMGRKLKKRDELTGLLSKSYYKAAIEKLIYEYPNEKGILLIVGFKDLFSFESPTLESIEDAVYQASQILKRYKRPKTILFRVSDRKLGIYVHNVINEETVLTSITKDIENMLRQKREYENIQYYIGTSYYPLHEKNADALVNGAIYALETLRKDKKQYHINNYQIYDPASRKEFVDKQYLYDEVGKIINERRIYSVFQPIIDLKTGKTAGYEALSRPISNLIPNIGMLLSLATELNVMPELEFMLIYIANRTVYDNKEQFKDKMLFINTNTSVKYGDKELTKFKSSIDKITENLVVEITEYDEIDLNIISERIKEVKDMGAKIAVDDFGSGYSNELALLSLKPDIVKIDMELIRGIHEDYRKYQIVENLTKYAKNNNIKVLAEGVETPSELKVVKFLNIDYVQGFIFAKPNKIVIDEVYNIDDYIQGRIKNKY